MTTTQRDLYVYRGTYKEIKKLKIEDMGFYLAWDTQQLFVGNSNGVLVEYGVPKSVYKKIENQFEDIKKQIEADNQVKIIELLPKIADEKISEQIINLRNVLYQSIKEELTSYLSDNVNNVLNELNDIRNNIVSNNTNIKKLLKDSKTVNLKLETFKNITDELQKITKNNSDSINSLINNFENQKNIISNLSLLINEIQTKKLDTAVFNNKISDIILNLNTLKITIENLSQNKADKSEIIKIKSDIDKYFEDFSDDYILTKNNISEDIKSLKENLDILNKFDTVLNQKVNNNKTEIDNEIKIVYNKIEDNKKEIKKTNETIISETKKLFYSINHNTIEISDIKKSYATLEFAKNILEYATLINQKINKSDVENLKKFNELKNKVNSVEDVLNGKLDNLDVYNKAEIDSKLTNLTNKINEMLENSDSFKNYYTKTEIDKKFKNINIDETSVKKITTDTLEEWINTNETIKTSKFTISTSGIPAKNRPGKGTLSITIILDGLNALKNSEFVVSGSLSKIFTDEKLIIKNVDNPVVKTISDFSFSPGSYNLTLNGNLKDEDKIKKIKYSLIGNSINFRIIQPLYFGNMENLIDCGEDKTLTAEITEDSYVYIYSPTQLTLENIKSSGFTVPFDPINISENIVENGKNKVEKIVNQISCQYYLYRSSEKIKDTKITVNI